MNYEICEKCKSNNTLVDVVYKLDYPERLSTTEIYCFSCGYVKELGYTLKQVEVK